MVTARLLNHVGDELGADRGAALVLLVLSCVEEVRDDGCDAPGTGDLASMNHDEQLHEAGIRTCEGAGSGRGAARGVDDIDIVFSYALGDAHDTFARLIARDCCFA